MSTRTRGSKQSLASQRVAAASPLVAFPQTMNSLVSKFSSSTATSQLKTAQKYLQQEEEECGEPTMWGSAGGFGNMAAGIPSFQIPAVADVRMQPAISQVNLTTLQPTSFLRLHTDDAADPSCRIKIQHGTTTLAFRFQGGVIVAVDSRATAGSYIGESSLQASFSFGDSKTLWGSSFGDGKEGH